MIYTPLTRKAMELCLAAHGEQRDKGGYPYIFHPIHLAEQMPDEYSVIAALLHDVGKPTSFTIDEQGRDISTATPRLAPPWPTASCIG